MPNRHYVYVDSRNRNPNESNNNFTVHLQNAVKNVTRCGVISFSIANTHFNVTESNRMFQWFEIHLNTYYYYKTFTITLDTGYYSVTSLLNNLVTKMNATSGRQVSSETVTTYSFEIDDDFRVTITGSSANSEVANRWWGFLVDSNDVLFNNSIIHSILSFNRSQVLKTSQLQEIANPFNILVNENLSPTNLYTKAWAQSRTNLTTAQRSLKANMSYSENQSLIHLASDILSENSSRMVFKDRHSTTQKTHILESIPVTVNRWSYIQMNKATFEVLWHSLDNVNVDHFDLKLLNEHYTLFDSDSHADFKACLVFETADESHTEINQMHREYNLSAYLQSQIVPSR